MVQVPYLVKHMVFNNLRDTSAMNDIKQIGHEVGEFMTRCALQTEYHHGFL